MTIAGCASTSGGTPGDAAPASPTQRPRTLTGRDFDMAVAVARAEVANQEATVTSATATVGDGVVTDANAGPPADCSDPRHGRSRVREALLDRRHDRLDSTGRRRHVAVYELSRSTRHMHA
jgi:hypothetical protein